MTPAPAALRLPSHEGRLLIAHLERLCSWDPQALVRVVARARALGVYGTPPMEVMSFVALPLVDPVAEEIDVTAYARDVRAGIEESASAVALTLPEPIVGDSALAVLPPSDGWQLPIAGVSGDLIPLVDESVAEFRRRSAEGADAQIIAQEIWDRPGFGGLPMRVLHAARRLGFLSDDASRVSAVTCTGWKRLTTVRGQVFLRTTPPVSRASLSVVK
ncbi:MAG: hypothetical protein ACR2KE_01515 [Candidatus Nanopelagicales bacterium]